MVSENKLKKKMKALDFSQESGDEVKLFAIA